MADHGARRGVLNRGHARPAAAAVCAKALVAWLLPPAALAAQPLVTDDARTVETKSCQFEIGVKKYRSSDDYWALPGCNFGGDLEWTLGGTRTDDDAGHSTAIVLQAKKVFKPLQPNGWAWGVVVGNVRPRHPGEGASGAGELYAYVPVTFSFRDDRLALHANAGWARDAEERRHRMTWGVASEAQITPRTMFVAEVFGQNTGKPFYQAGFRVAIVANRVEFDATHGNRFGGSGNARWIAVGLRFLSVPFLP